MTISEIVGREVLDSRGNPTVEATVMLTNGLWAQAMVPSGASTGAYEAVELRDNDANRYGGNGVLQAVSNINSVLAPQLIGLCPDDLSVIDATMIAIDGTQEKGNLGANAILAVSMATARVISEANGHNGALWEFLSCGNSVTLPVPMLNILNGGRHASNSTDIQEFMVLPIGFDTFSESLRCGVEIYQSLKNILREGGYNLNVGDEGGFAPSLNSNREAIELVLRSVEAAGYLPGKQVFFGLDVAASELFDESDNKYVLDREGRSLTSDELISLYAEWVSEYPILSIEDGLDEDDWDGWVRLTEKLGNKVQLVGDDLFVTNISRIEKGDIARAGNSVLLKPNQIGTITETLQALERTRAANWGAVMSHRSGETEDSIIADLAVGWNVGQIKAGAPARSDRVAKYNRLLRIEQSLGDRARYMGRQAYEYLGSGISN
ncbi:MAG: phosphopyruvate hydratase [Chloroflexota bacterium]|nr:phosphopyruvate hydratase [Chloroflexota bacterium]